MARYLGPTCKLSRREGTDLLLKSRGKSLEGKCKLEQRPGQHGAARTRNSDYALQLRAKQRIRRIYGILEKQFRKHYDDVKNRPGVTGNLLLARLELRLDNVVYRLGFAQTRPQARQIVNHSMIYVNGKKMSIPSYEVKVGDEITINPTKKENGYFKNQEQYIKNKKRVVGWLSLNQKDMSGKMVALPKRDDFDANINAQIIVEFYSK